MNATSVVAVPLPPVSPPLVWPTPQAKLPPAPARRTVPGGLKGMVHEVWFTMITAAAGSALLFLASSPLGGSALSVWLG